MVAAFWNCLFGFLWWVGPHSCSINSSCSFVRVVLRICFGRFISSSFLDKLVRLKFPCISICVWIDIIEFHLCCLSIT